jgi:hypothetical protein
VTPLPLRHMRRRRVAGARIIHDELVRRFTEACREAQARPLMVLPPSAREPDIPRRVRRRLQLQAPAGRMRRHTYRLRVDGLRPADGSFDSFVQTQVLRRSGFLPEDLQLRREDLGLHREAS